MSETPAPGGFPDPSAPPPVDPNAPATWAAPAPGAEAPPTAAWGQPAAAPYGAPFAPPPKKKRIWLRVLLGIVGVIVLLGVIGVVIQAVRPRHHLTLHDTAAGLTKATPSAGTAEFLSTVSSTLNSYNPKHLVTGAYTDGDQQLAILGADTGRFDDANNLINAFQKGAESTGQVKFQDYPIGDGAHLRCASAQGAELCAWVDKDTFAILFEPGNDASHLAGLSTQLRIDLEKK